MGHKVNPKIFRISTNSKWNSQWFATGKDYAKNVEEDVKIKKYLLKKLRDTGIDRIETERTADKLTIIIHSAKPGMIIGRGGGGVEEIKKYLQKNIIKNNKKKIDIDIKEVSKPQLSAQVVAGNIAIELEKRIPYRKAMKRMIESSMKAGAQGIKIICSGRLDGAEIARTEKLSQGKVPLHTLRADIDYARTAAFTTYGAVGVKVWIYKGEYFEKKDT